MARRFDTRDDDFSARFDAFLAEPRGDDADVRDQVRAILSDVRARGFAAVADYTARFDRHDVTVDTVQIAPDRMAEALARCPADLREALELAAARIEAYHRAARPEGATQEERGLTLSSRWTPIDAVGLYTPGGRARYPSSLLMNAIPARAAGVKRRVMVTPAPDGKLDDVMLATAALAGITEAYAIGGAQAVGALAYGAGPIAPVDKIVGPGNAYVAAAKREVFGDVGIDTIAGPSEVLVVADDHQRADILAADLLAQAEHDPAAQSVLVCFSSAIGDAVVTAVEETLDALPDTSPAHQSWPAHGAVICVRDEDEAASLIDRMAPEHLELALRAPEGLLARVRHAGAIFVGSDTPEAMGDYITGSNHVLPTSRAARFSSGLSTVDFMKRTSIQQVHREGLARLGPHAARLADEEGLPAHALSIRRRLATS